MIPKLTDATYLSGYTLHLRFADGVEGDIDLEPELWGPVFEPLRDPDLFRQFLVHPQWHTLVWPNGADLAPEFLYEKVLTAA